VHTFLLNKSIFSLIKNTSNYRYIISIIVVLIYLVLEKIDFQLAQFFNYFVFGLGLMFIGIPHGALDHMLLNNKKTSLTVFILKYLMLVGFYYLIWQLFPAISLIIFLIYSSFHFGESEINNNFYNFSKIYTYLQNFLIGLSILLFIIFSHINESILILKNLISIPNIDYQFISWLICIISIFYILFQYFYFKNKKIWGLLFILSIGVYLPLIFSFGLYFIFQHSFNAWTHLQIGLSMSSKELYKKSWVYSLGAIVILFFILYFRGSFTEIDLWVNMFIFMACISLPHFILMHLFYKNKTILI
jgi:Brp/Blh family beta-carotene 15,15'-monooxygenase